MYSSWFPFFLRPLIELTKWADEKRAMGGAFLFKKNSLDLTFKDRSMQAYFIHQYKVCFYSEETFLRYFDLRRLKALKIFRWFKPDFRQVK